MTTDPPPAEDTGSPAPLEPPAKDRLPDDHPVVKALTKANKEAETLRHQLKEFQDRDKSELEKLTEALNEKDGQIAALPKQIRTQVLAFASAATTRGFLDPEDALAFLPDDIDLSDRDAVTAALDALAERKPHLVKTLSKKLPARPKAKSGDDTGSGDEGLTGKERAAAALRQFKNT